MTWRPIASNCRLDADRSKPPDDRCRLCAGMLEGLVMFQLNVAFAGVARLDVAPLARARDHRCCVHPRVNSEHCFDRD